jgi:hypothetical protein
MLRKGGNRSESVEPAPQIGFLPDMIVLLAGGFATPPTLRRAWTLIGTALSRGCAQAASGNPLLGLTSSTDFSAAINRYQPYWTVIGTLLRSRMAQQSIQLSPTKQAASFGQLDTPSKVEKIAPLALRTIWSIYV